MHIALIIPDVRSGGAQKMMINLANEFADMGHKVDIVLINDTGSYYDLIDPAVNIINFKKSRTFFSILELSRYFSLCNPDVMLSALFHVNLAVILSKYVATSSATKIIISERNHLSLRLSDLNFIKSLIIRSLVKLLYPLADKIISISDGVQDDLKSIINKKLDIATIYNPVVTKNFELQAKKTGIDIFPKYSGLKLITSGRLVKQKDYPTLLKAIDLYLKNYGDVHLVILGEGELYDELLILSKELKIDTNVSFLGFKENPLIYMKQADMFVISSAWEGFCNVIVEALYLGLKVVSTDCKSGPSEILNKGEFGALVNVSDPEDLVKKIYQESQKNNYPKKQKNRALEFTSEKKAEEFLVVFKEVLEK